MSVALLVILPILLSGYVFATECKYFYYQIIRQEGYHLYFRAARYGSSLVLAAAAVYLLIYNYSPDCIILFASKLKAFFDATFASKGTPVFDLVLVSLLSIFLAYLTAGILNSEKLFGFGEEFSFSKAIENDDFELLVYKAINDRKPVAFSMEGRKEYVGTITRGFEPKEERKFIRILPIVSGYRDKDTLSIEHTTQYKEVTDEITRPNSSKARPMNLDEFEIILPVNDIKSAHLFDNEVFLRFQRGRGLLVEEASNVLSLETGEYVQFRDDLTVLSK